MDWIARPDAWIALATLTVLELVLGIDNIVFISILSEKARTDRRAVARNVGLAMAMLTRVALLFSIAWVMGLTRTILEVGGRELSWRDLILIFGGVFLLTKSTREIHGRLEGEVHGDQVGAGAGLAGVILQIALLDMIFSLDSVITAVGMADDLGVMVTAVVVATGFMMLAAGPVSRFVIGPSHGEDAGTQLSLAHRNDAGRRGSRATHQQGLHLLRHGFLGLRGDAQSESASGERTAGPPARPHTGRGGVAPPPMTRNGRRPRRSGARGVRYGSGITWRR